MEKWLWKPWNDGSFYWNVLDMCFQTLDDFGDENVEAWALALYKTDGCLDAIPFQFYRTTTIPKIWVGLDWKFINLSGFPCGQGLSWGYLVKIVHLCSTQDDSWSWLGGQTHRRGSYTRACNWKVRIDYPHTEYGEFRICSWRMYRMLWWKCTISAECQTIRIAASAVMDSWSGHTVPPSDFSKWLLKWIETLTWPQQSCDLNYKIPLRIYKILTSFGT